MNWRKTEWYVQFRKQLYAMFRKILDDILPGGSKLWTYFTLYIFNRPLCFTSAPDDLAQDWIMNDKFSCPGTIFLAYIKQQCKGIIMKYGIIKQKKTYLQDQDLNSELKMGNHKQIKSLHHCWLKSKEIKTTPTSTMLGYKIEHTRIKHLHDSCG